MQRLLLSLFGSLALAGCGGGTGSSDSQPPGQSSGQTLSIAETEYSLSPSTVEVANRGTVTIKVTNDGRVAHALTIEGHGLREETGTIPPGRSATVAVQLDQAGDYEIYCPIDGHRGKGMEGTLIGGLSMSGGTQTGSGTTTEDSPGY